MKTYSPRFDVLTNAAPRQDGVLALGGATFCILVDAASTPAFATMRALQSAGWDADLVRHVKGRRIGEIVTDT